MTTTADFIFPVPLIDSDLVATLKLPIDLSVRDAKRISDVVMSLSHENATIQTSTPLETGGKTDQVDTK